jgi:hypothetical protein
MRRSASGLPTGEASRGLDSKQIPPPNVQDVRVDGYNATASIVGRAPPVVLSELKLALMEATDPSDTSQQLAI